MFTGNYESYQSPANTHPNTSFSSDQSLYSATADINLTNATLTSNSINTLPGFNSRFERGMGVPVEEQTSHPETQAPVQKVQIGM